MATAGQRAGGRRHIGPLGTAARTMVGMGLLGSVLYGHLTGEFRPGPWLLGSVGFPAVPLAWQWWRSRRTPAPFDATGPVAQVLNIAVFVALYTASDSLPVLWATSDATLVFYGASMLVAATRGYAGCEVLAFSNWLLRRDDQVGCLLFAPVDYLERHRAGGDGSPARPRTC